MIYDMTKRPKGSWEPVAKWYGEYMGKDGGDYQKDIVFPGALRLLEAVAGGAYLDLACGQGAFSRLLAQKTKASITGIDASTSLISQAKRTLSPSIKFLVGDALSFSKLVSPESLDGIVCNLAIQNMDPLEPVFEQAARTLKQGGYFVITMNHPAYRQPRQSGWGWDEERKLQYRRVDKYMGEYEMPIIAHPGSAPGIKTYSYHRPLSAYINTLAKHGFMVDALEEWVSNKTSDSGPRARAENIARKEIPLFLGLRAVKIL